MHRHVRRIDPAGGHGVIDAGALRVAALGRTDIGADRHPHIADDTHDLVPRSEFPLVPWSLLLLDVHVAQPPADRVQVAEHALHEQLVHDHYTGAGVLRPRPPEIHVAVARPEPSAQNDRCRDRVEEIAVDGRRAHAIPMWPAGIARRHRTLIDFDDAMWVVHERQPVRERDLRDFGLAGHATRQLLIGRAKARAKCGERRVRAHAGCGLAIHLETHREEFPDRESDVHLLELHRIAPHEECDRRERYRNRDLSHDDDGPHATEPQPAAARGRLLQARADAARHLERGHDARDCSRDYREHGRIE